MNVWINYVFFLLLRGDGRYWSPALSFTTVDATVLTLLHTILSTGDDTNNRVEQFYGSQIKNKK